MLSNPIVQANIQPPTEEQALANIYGPQWGLVSQLLEIQRLRDQLSQLRIGQTQQAAGRTVQLANMQAQVAMGVEQAKNLASQVAISVGNAMAQQQRDLDAMRARAQSPSLTNIALGPEAGRSITPLNLPAPDIAAQSVPSIPSLAALGTIGGAASATGTQPVTAWWSWPAAGGVQAQGGTGSMGSAALGGSTTMGSAGGNPAGTMWTWGGVTAPANTPGQNVAAGLPGLPPPP